MSSGTNLVLTLLIARELTTDGFGAFAVAFTIYSFLIGANRALIAQPLVVRYTSGEDEAFHRASRAATGAATWPIRSMLGWRSQSSKPTGSRFNQ